MTFTVLIFTTDGLAFLARCEKDPGAPDKTGPVWALSVEVRSSKVPRVNPAMRKKSDQAIMIVFLMVVF